MEEVKAEIRHIKAQMLQYQDFSTVRALTYGLAATILLAVLGAILKLVIPGLF